MKKILGALLTLAFSTQAFALGRIFVSSKDMSNMPKYELGIFLVQTPTEKDFDYVTISASASDHTGFVLQVHKNVLKYMQMDVASFMSLLTSKETNAMVGCLDAELENRIYTCKRLSLSAMSR